MSKNIKVNYKIICDWFKKFTNAYCDESGKWKCEYSKSKDKVPSLSNMEARSLEYYICCLLIMYLILNKHIKAKTEISNESIIAVFKNEIDEVNNNKENPSMFIKSINNSLKTILNKKDWFQTNSDSHSHAFKNKTPKNNVVLKLRSFGHDNLQYRFGIEINTDKKVLKFHKLWNKRSSK